MFEAYWLTLNVIYQTVNNLHSRMFPEYFLVWRPQGMLELCTCYTEQV